MKLTIPELSLVVLIGPSGSGKSTFARKHFRPTEVLSSDYCRGLVSDDENDQAATKDAFEVLNFIGSKRLAAARLTAIDATNVQEEARRPLVALARQYHCLPIAIVFDLPEKLCQERNKGRPDRTFGAHVIRQQAQQMRRSLKKLKREGFRHIFILSSLEEIEAATIERQPLWNDRRAEHGPCDIIGDVHGCLDELMELLAALGYTKQSDGSVTHPAGRKLIFVGDLVDRGPKIPETVRLVMETVKGGHAFCVPGNHDIKFMRAIAGKDVQLRHGLPESLRQFETYEEHHPGFTRGTAEFIDSLVSHYVFDDGKLVVAHAGMKEEMQGRGSGRVREFALFGETTGETDEFGLQVRYNWAADYRGRAMVVYGHTPVPEPEWLNRTINVDTGCVFGGRLTALRYPEKEIVSVPAKHTYFEPAKPFLPAESAAPALSAQQQLDDVLDMADVLGKRIVSTRLHFNVTVREENAIAALEVMSRFATNPKWLIYLPPTMSPTATTTEPNLLEHPAEAFAYYRHEGIDSVVCEEKHMGSRAVLIVCRDEEAAQKRFGVIGETGVCYTRTGRRFFEKQSLENKILDRLRAALSASDFWKEFASDWVCLDCELMPWSAKAQELIRQQYAAVGAAGRAVLPQVVGTLETAERTGLDVAELLARCRRREGELQRYVEAYRNYCWPVNSIADLRIAPFHILAAEGKVFSDRDHLWHMKSLAAICANDPTLLLATPHRRVDLVDPENQKAAIDWWSELTARGGEGMVVKPFQFTAKGRRGLVQPAIKCRGREYLRIIYGPEYTAPENLERLRGRGLSAKRSLALREFALGIEALERFVAREPLRRIHECVFGILALESEPVDPRL
jgi:protein phosphatase